MLTLTLSSKNTTDVKQPILDDVALIRAVANRDRSAFEELFRLYHGRINKFSIRMLNDHQSAEEVACDTLFAVWNSASNFREQSAVSSWILGIAYRRSLKNFNANAKHTEQKESERQLEELAETSPEVDPERFAEQASEISQLDRALAGLSSNHRAVMELIALEYSVKEIAEIVECPENTVKTRTFHARKLLKVALGNCTTG